MIEFRWFSHDDLVVNLISHWSVLVPLHDLKQDLVSVLVPEELNDSLWSQSLFQTVEILFFSPVTTHAFKHNAWTIFLKSELRESLSDHLSDSRAFVLPEKLVAELYDVIAEGVVYYFVDAEGNLIDKLLLGFASQLFNLLIGVILLQVGDKFYHVLYDAHAILIQSKVQEVLLGVLQEGVRVDDRE